MSICDWITLFTHRSTVAYIGIYIYIWICCNNDVWVWIILFLKVDKVKIQNSVYSIDPNFCSINQNDEENNPRVSRWFNRYSIPTPSIEKSIRSIETWKTKFSVEFSSNCSKSLKRFQALWMVLWNNLTLHMCLLMKYNPMGINRGLWLEKNTRNLVSILHNCYL